MVPRSTWLQKTFPTGRSASSTETLSSLVMTLPRMLETAVERRRDDPQARIVYPLAEWRIEISEDYSTRILTLITSDGFKGRGSGKSSVGFFRILPTPSAAPREPNVYHPRRAELSTPKRRGP